MPIVNRFLRDIAAVYPGPMKEGLSLKKISLPTPEEMEIEHLMPKESQYDHDVEDFELDEEWDSGDDADGDETFCL